MKLSILAIGPVTNSSPPSSDSVLAVFVCQNVMYSELYLPYA